MYTSYNVLNLKDRSSFIPVPLLSGFVVPLELLQENVNL
jgi:hypothetical protein